MKRFLCVRVKARRGEGEGERSESPALGLARRSVQTSGSVVRIDSKSRTGSVWTSARILSE